MDKAGVCSEWIDKSQLLHQAAETTGRILLWHKIATINRPLVHKPRDTKHTDRVCYSHLLCFAAAGTTYSIKDCVLPDFFDRGDVIWHKGMGLRATLYAVKFVQSMGATCIIDPFCGKGTVLAAANFLQLPAIGVELNPKVARKAESLDSKVFASVVTETVPAVVKPSQNEAPVAFLNKFGRVRLPLLILVLGALLMVNRRRLV